MLQAHCSISRGCPFQCEFCDIIVIFGRRPRVKEPDQLVAELDDMRRAGFHSAFIVDDNFIGNKKKAKALFEQIIPGWSSTTIHCALTTEASIDLADDAGAAGVDVPGQFPQRVHRDRDAATGFAQGDQEVSERPRRLAGSQAGADSERRASTSTPGSSSASTATTRGFSKTSFGSSRTTASRWRWSACCRRFPGRRSTNGCRREGRLVEEDPNCNFVPKQMTPR